VVGDPDEPAPIDAIRKALLKKVAFWENYVKENPDDKDYQEYRDEYLEQIGILAKENVTEDEIDHIVDGLDLGSYSNLSVVYCPTCQMKFVTDGDMLDFILRVIGSNKKEVADTMRKAYGNDYNKMKGDLKCDAKKTDESNE